VPRHRGEGVCDSPWICYVFVEGGEFFLVFFSFLENLWFVVAQYSVLKLQFHVGLLASPAFPAERALISNYHSVVTVPTLR
jgi:hypothetical protein